MFQHPIQWAPIATTAFGLVGGYAYDKEQWTLLWWMLGFALAISLWAIHAHAKDIAKYEPEAELPESE